MAEEVATIPPLPDQPVRDPSQPPREVRLDAEQVEGVLGHERAPPEDKTNRAKFGRQTQRVENSKTKPICHRVRLRRLTHTEPCPGERRTQSRARSSPLDADGPIGCGLIRNSIVSRREDYHTIAWIPSSASGESSRGRDRVDVHHRERGSRRTVLGPPLQGRRELIERRLEIRDGLRDEWGHQPRELLAHGELDPTVLGGQGIRSDPFE